MSPARTCGAIPSRARLTRLPRRRDTRTPRPDDTPPDGEDRRLQTRFDVGPEGDGQHAAAAARERLVVAGRLGRLQHAEGVARAGDGLVRRIVGGELDDDGGRRAAPVEVPRPEEGTGA